MILSCVEINHLVVVSVSCCLWVEIEYAKARVHRG